MTQGMPSLLSLDLRLGPEARLGEFSERGEESVAVKKNQFNPLQS